MPQQPLYVSTKIPTVVNPAKIISSLMGNKHQQAEKSSAVQYTSAYSAVPKNKTIAKPDNRKNYRTKMCPYGRECKKRFTCNFAHNEHELRRPFMKRKNQCLLYQRGQCSLGSACRDYHGNIDLQKNYRYKTKICEQFLIGKCLKGDQICIYIHEGPSKVQQQHLEQQQLPLKQQQQLPLKQQPPLKQQKSQKSQKQKRQQKQQNQQEKPQKSEEVQKQKQQQEFPNEPLFISF